MAIQTDKSIFYHIPKTGGTWVKAAIQHSGLRYENCKHLHREHPFGLLRAHATPTGTEAEGFSFCFVRHPVAWYRSFWCYRAERFAIHGPKRDMSFPADHCWDTDPGQFAHNLMDAFPGGFVTQLYQFYVHDVDYVGQQETLREDLVEALTLAGEDFDAEAVRGLPNRHRSITENYHIDEAVEERIRVVEGWILETYYKVCAASHQGHASEEAGEVVAVRDLL